MSSAEAPGQVDAPPIQHTLGVAPGAPLVPVLPELDPRWSRTVRAADAHGVQRTWHVLDTGPQDPARRPAGTDDSAPVATLVCVHGNPTWSYLWRRVLDAAPAGWRVVAPDHLGMGYSEQLDEPRTLAERVNDLTGLLDTLRVEGPVYLLVHDWGGPIGLGWATEQPLQPGGGRWLAGVVLTNTAIHQPQDQPEPAAIRLAHTPGVRQLVCRATPTFVRATTAISRRGIDPELRDAYAAPYRTAERRAGVADFVADIPFRSDHPSAATLDRIASNLNRLHHTPVLMLWGLRDPVFSQIYLTDLAERLPQADIQKYPDASHLVLEDTPAGVGVIWTWLTRTHQTHAPQAAEEPQPAGGSGRRRHPDRSEPSGTVAGVPIEVALSNPGDVAIVELGAGGRQITFAGLAERVAAVAAGLAARGIQPGQRVALLVPPGIDLTTVVYALWRLGAVVVIADAGLGVRRLGGALRDAAPDHLIAIRKGLLLAAAARVPGARHRFEPADAVAIARQGLRAGPPPEPPIDPDDDGAILFTSGATGPPKGVVYTRRRLSAQVALVRQAFDLTPGTRFVAAFAPFALYGAALGLPSAVPDMDVTAPHTLSATALAGAIHHVGADVVFASPAALRNVAATAAELSAGDRRALRQVRLLMSAGAPVPVSLLQSLRELLPDASMQTPYGMTEALPVATIDPTTAPRGDAHPDGVCVGAPIDGVQVLLAPLDSTGTPSRDIAEMTAAPGVLGEIVVHGPHTKDRYDHLWAMDLASAHPPGWHRTGDVAEFDDAGRIWVQGRLAHVIGTSAGPVPPYGIEQRVEGIEGVEAAAAVGVGPAGTQQIAVVVVPRARLPRVTGTPLASADLVEQVRAVAGVPVAAVLRRDWLPVDIRHASKVDRNALAAWVTRWLHGREAAAALTQTSGRAPATRSR